ncbi:MAG: hypothetical protein ACR2FO_07250 [Actinomycetota bacterium]
MWVLEELPATGPEAVVAAGTWTPDVVLLDHWIPGMDATVVLTNVISKSQNARVLSAESSKMRLEAAGAKRSLQKRWPR